MAAVTSLVHLRPLLSISSFSSQLYFSTTVAAVTLLGPPEIYTFKSNPNPTTAQTTTTTNDVFVNQMVANFNSLPSNRNPPMGFTENMSPTFLSTANPCLDFFFHVVSNTPSETLVERLKLAWSHNPLTTLKLVCNLRGIRGTGKSNKKGFYTAALWLHENHPKTLATNVPSFADFGSFKDLPEILYRLLEGSEVRKTQKEEWDQRKFSSISRREINKKRHHNKNKDVMTEVVVAARAKAQKETAHALKEEKRIALAQKLVDRYNRDPDN